MFRAVVAVADQAVFQILLGEGAAHPENLSVAQQVAVLNIAVDAELTLVRCVIRVSRGEHCRGDDLVLTLVEGGAFVGDKAVICFADGVVVEGYNAHIHHGRGCVVGRAGIILHRHPEAVVKVFAAVMGVTQLAIVDLGLGKGSTRHHYGFKSAVVIAIEFKSAVGGEIPSAVNSQGENIPGIHITGSNITVINNDRGAFVNHHLFDSDNRLVIDRGGLEGHRAVDGIPRSICEFNVKGRRVVFTTIVLKLDAPCIQIGLGEGAVEAQIPGITYAVSRGGVKIEHAGSGQAGQAVGELCWIIVDIARRHGVTVEGHKRTLIKTALGTRREHGWIVLYQHHDATGSAIGVRGGIIHGIGEFSEPAKVGIGSKANGGVAIARIEVARVAVSNQFNSAVDRPLNGDNMQWRVAGIIAQQYRLTHIKRRVLRGVELFVVGHDRVIAGAGISSARRAVTANGAAPADGAIVRRTIRTAIASIVNRNVHHQVDNCAAIMDAALAIPQGDFQAVGIKTGTIVLEFYVTVGDIGKAEGGPRPHGDEIGAVVKEQQAVLRHHFNAEGQVFNWCIHIAGV